MIATAPVKPAAGRAIAVRRAVRDDLPRIVALLADDGLGRGRDDPTLPLDERYMIAFEQIDSLDNHLMLVLQDGDLVAGYLQLSFIPGLSHHGMWRGNVEAVRIAADRRGRGLGTVLLGHAIAECRRRGCGLVQLTANNSRVDAKRFYERLGFVASHQGLRLTLSKE